MTAKSTYQTLLYETSDDHVATVTLNRPEVMNAFNRTMCDEFRDVWRCVRDLYITVVWRCAKGLYDIFVQRCVKGLYDIFAWRCVRGLYGCLQTKL